MKIIVYYNHKYTIIMSISYSLVKFESLNIIQAYQKISLLLAALKNITKEVGLTF